MSCCERCGFALPIDVRNAAGPCEQCALEAETLADIENYLRLAADFERYCAEREERLASGPAEELPEGEGEAPSHPVAPPKG